MIESRLHREVRPHRPRPWTAAAVAVSIVVLVVLACLGFLDALGGGQ